MKVAAIGVGLSAYLRPADAARVIVLLAARQDEQEFLRDGRRSFAADAEEARRLQLAKAVYHGLILDQESVGRAWSASSSQMDGVIQVRTHRLPMPVRRRPVTGLGGGAFGFCLADWCCPRGRRGADESWPHREQGWPRLAAQTRHSHSQVGAPLQLAHIAGSSGSVGRVRWTVTRLRWKLQPPPTVNGPSPARTVHPTGL